MEFSRESSFEDNLEVFLLHMDAVDAEMAQILRSNLGLLAACVQGGERDNAARASFNQSIQEALVSLLETSASDKEG